MQKKFKIFLKINNFFFLIFFSYNFYVDKILNSNHTSTNYTNIILFVHINFFKRGVYTSNLLLFLVKLYYYTYLSSQPHIPQEIMSSSRSWMLTKIGKKCKIKNWSVLHFSVFINVMPLWRTKITKLIITLYLWRQTNLEDVTLIGDAMDRSKSLVNCNFNWVRRELRASASVELKI